MNSICWDHTRDRNTETEKFSERIFQKSEKFLSLDHTVGDLNLQALGWSVSSYCFNRTQCISCWISLVTPDFSKLLANLYHSRHPNRENSPASQVHLTNTILSNVAHLILFDFFINFLSFHAYCDFYLDVFAAISESLWMNEQSEISSEMTSEMIYFGAERSTAIRLSGVGPTV